MNHIVVIFDWDDTLINIGAILQQCQHAACIDILSETERYPFTTLWKQPTLNDLESHIGARFLETIIPKLFPNFERDNAQHNQWAQDCYQRFREHYKNQEKSLLPGITTMLSTLKKQAIPLAIATNKSRELLIQELEQCQLEQDVFNQIICGDDAEVTPHFKPDPRMLQIIQACYGPSHQYIMVGDQETDIIAAQQCPNMYSIGVGNPQKWRSVSPSISLNSAAEITIETIKSIVGPDHK